MQIVSLIPLVVIVLVFLLSFYPFRLSNGFRSSSMLLPFLALVCFGFYEVAMRIAIPSINVPIRVDLLLIVPLLGFIVFAGVVRLCIILWNQRCTTTLDSESLIRRNRYLQIGIIIPCFLLAALMLCFLIGC